MVDSSLVINLRLKILISLTMGMKRLKLTSGITSSDLGSCECDKWNMHRDYGLFLMMDLWLGLPHDFTHDGWLRINFKIHLLFISWWFVLNAHTFFCPFSNSWNKFQVPRNCSYSKVTSIAPSWHLHFNLNWKPSSEWNFEFNFRPGQQKTLLKKKFVAMTIDRDLR